MRLPRDVSGRTLLASLHGWATKPYGTHVRVTTQVNGEHHEVIPQHNPVKARTLLSILKSVARHHGMSVEELLSELQL